METPIRWEQVFSEREKKNPITEKVKVIIFYYLLFRGPDYGYNISKVFKKAIDKRTFVDSCGFGDLKYPNKVEAALKSMCKSRLLIEADEDKGPKGRRNYYRINPNVFLTWFVGEVPEKSGDGFSISCTYIRDDDSFFEVLPSLIFPQCNGGRLLANLRDPVMRRLSGISIPEK